MNQAACTTTDNNFDNSAMLTDASGVPQVMYQYDLRTSLFTSINANNIRNPFTSLGEAGAITDSLTLTTNVDWTVYRGGVSIDSNIINMFESYKKMCDMLKKKGTKDPYARMGFGLDCTCWNNRSHKVFTESEKEILRQALKEQGMKESDIDEAIENYRKTVEKCCSTHKDPDGNTRRGEKANIILLGEAQDDTIGYVGCVYFSTPNNGAVGGRYIVYAP